MSSTWFQETNIKLLCCLRKTSNCKLSQIKFQSRLLGLKILKQRNSIGLCVEMFTFYHYMLDQYHANYLFIKCKEMTFLKILYTSMNNLLNSVIFYIIILCHNFSRPISRSTGSDILTVQNLLYYAF